MNRRALLGFLLFAFSMMPAQADSRFITRDSSGLSGMQAVCLALGCTVAESLDGSLGQVFLITTPDAVNSSTFLQVLLTQPDGGIEDLKMAVCRGVIVQVFVPRYDGIQPSD